MSATIERLKDELVERVSLCAAVKDKTFKVFNIEDLEDMVQAVSYPIAGVVYEGSAHKENSALGATATRSSAAMLITRSFMVIVGTNYRYASMGDGQLVVAEGLLESIVPKLLGYVGVSNRPWRFVGETAMESLLEGAVFYGQMWETDIPIVSDI